MEYPKWVKLYSSLLPTKLQNLSCPYFFLSLRNHKNSINGNVLSSLTARGLTQDLGTVWFNPSSRCKVCILCVSVGVPFWGGCDGPTVSGRALHPQWRSGLLCHGLRQLGHHILCTIATVGPVSTCLSWFYTELWL